MTSGDSGNEKFVNLVITKYTNPSRNSNWAYVGPVNAHYEPGRMYQPDLSDRVGGYQLIGSWNWYLQNLKIFYNFTERTIR